MEKGKQPGLGEPNGQPKGGDVRGQRAQGQPEQPQTTKGEELYYRRSEFEAHLRAYLNRTMPRRVFFGTTTGVAALLTGMYIGRKVTVQSEIISGPGPVGGEQGAAGEGAAGGEGSGGEGDAQGGDTSGGIEQDAGTEQQSGEGAPAPIPVVPAQEGMSAPDSTPIAAEAVILQPQDVAATNAAHQATIQEVEGRVESARQRIIELEFLVNNYAGQLAERKDENEMPPPCYVEGYGPTVATFTPVPTMDGNGDGNTGTLTEMPTVPPQPTATSRNG